MQRTPADGFAWDDLRTVLAVARAGSLTGAARQLGVNHSTVFRRLGALEKELGTRLFERAASGYSPTAAGEDLRRVAERIEDEIAGLDRRLAGRDQTLSGLLRLTAPDDVMERLVIAPLARFRQRHPDIRLEAAIDNRNLNLTKREADIAIRPTKRPPESLVGRRIGPLAVAVYAPADDSGGDDLPWIAWEEGTGPASDARWLARQGPEETVVYRSNSLLNQLTACRLGLGRALLPCFLGDTAEGLCRLTPPLGELETDLWLLTHRDLRRTARVRALMDWLFEDLKDARALLAGEGV